MNDKTDIEKVDSEARVKTFTPGDLSFLLPLVEKIRAVEIKFHGHESPAGPAAAAAGLPAPDTESRLQALEAELAALKQLQRFGAVPTGEAPVELLPYTWKRSAAAAALTVLLLLFAHWLIVFVYDATTVLLLLSAIVIPASVAAWATRRREVKPWLEVGIAVGVAAVAVLAMSYVTSLHEKAAVLPENMREWRETIEYVASITFAYLTGVLITGAAYLRVRGPAAEGRLRLVRGIALLIARVLTQGPPLKKNLDTITKFVAAVAPLVSALVAIVTGVKGILG